MWADDDDVRFVLDQTFVILKVTAMQRICEVAFNIDISLQWQHKSSLAKIFVARIIASCRSRVEIILTF
jgi:hypothetical protein